MARPLSSSSTSVLKVIGTPDSMIDAIRLPAQAQLGFAIEFIPLDGLELQQQAVLHPETFHILDHWSLSTEVAWTAGAIQPIDINKATCWDHIMAGKGGENFLNLLQSEQSNSPFSMLFVQPDGSLGAHESGQLSMVPTLHHFDSFGFDPSLRDDMRAEEVESWSWLLDDRWRGKMALTGHAPIGILEMALAAKASGLMEFADVGNLSLAEIDQLIDILREFKRKNHFKAFWETSKQSVDLMADKSVIIESMWGHAIQSARGRNIPIVNAMPQEGYRAWMDGLSISNNCTGANLDRAYEFINWYLSGWVGSYFARMGVYMTAPERVQTHLEENEWRYWYLGEVAEQEIRDNDKNIIVQSGQRRRGGSYWQRMKKVAVWNSFMDEYNYLVRRWNEFLSS